MTRWPHLLAAVVAFGLPAECFPVCSPEAAQCQPAVLPHPLAPPPAVAISELAPPMLAGATPSSAALLRDAMVLWRHAERGESVAGAPPAAGVWCALALSYVALESVLRRRYVSANELPPEIAHARVDRLHLTLSKVGRRHVISLLSVLRFATPRLTCHANPTRDFF